MDSDKTITNKDGGKQSELNANYCLLDPRAMYALACVLNRGSKYGIDNWRLICIEEHLDHAINHLFKYIEGLRTGRGIEDDLSHAFCRVMFALAQEIDINGMHPEHTDEKYRISNPSPYERPDLRRGGLIQHSVPIARGFSQAERDTTTDNYPARRHDPIRT